MLEPLTAVVQQQVLLLGALLLWAAALHIAGGCMGRDGFAEWRVFPLVGTWDAVQQLAILHSKPMLQLPDTDS